MGDQAIALGGLAGFALAWGVKPWWSGWAGGVAGIEMVVIAVATLAPMTLLSVFGARTHLRRTTGLRPTPGKSDLPRVATKYLGLVGTLALLAGAYWVFPEYAKDRYAPVWEAAVFAAGPFLAAAWFYLLWVDQRMSEPHDGFWEAGRLFLGKWRETDPVRLREYALGWLVKGFFLPYMAAVLAAHLGSIPEAGWNLARFDQLYLAGVTLIYGLDTLFGMLGYFLTLRILDSHIRSVQPGVFGWVVALVCYTPFSGALASFQKYRSDNDWSTILSGSPLLFITCGFLILCCLSVYVWSTISFGCRFSNLTNRGIVATGPYRWLKHPAYVSKNLAWWLMFFPFCASAYWQDNLRASIMLGVMNFIYVLRAKTEERHLSADPAYRIYSRWMDRFGLLATLRNMLRSPGGIRRRSPGPAEMEYPA